MHNVSDTVRVVEDKGNSIIVYTLESKTFNTWWPKGEVVEFINNPADEDSDEERTEAKERENERIEQHFSPAEGR